ncbi:MAG: hypothetical protein CNCCGFBP_00348 [Fimbriimonadaceae bacterium]|nr:hypothetical protein [Fimbriimonadaceae bacterium]
MGLRPSRHREPNSFVRWASVIRQAQRAEGLERRATPWWNPAPKMNAACKVATLNSQLSTSRPCGRGRPLEQPRNKPRSHRRPAPQSKFGVAPRLSRTEPRFTLLLTSRSALRVRPGHPATGLPNLPDAGSREDAGEHHPKASLGWHPDWIVPTPASLGLRFTRRPAPQSKFGVAPRLSARSPASLGFRLPGLLWGQTGAPGRPLEQPRNKPRSHLRPAPQTEFGVAPSLGRFENSTHRPPFVFDDRIPDFPGQTARTTRPSGRFLSGGGA